MEDQQPPEGQQTYGDVIIGPERITMKIMDYMRCVYKDHRLISVLSIEDGTIVIGVENPPSTGREVSQTMRLSMESFVGMVGTMLFYLRAKGYDDAAFRELLEKAVDKHEIDFSCSPNLMNLEDIFANQFTVKMDEKDTDWMLVKDQLPPDGKLVEAQFKKSPGIHDVRYHHDIGSWWFIDLQKCVDPPIYWREKEKTNES